MLPKKHSEEVVDISSLAGTFYPHSNYRVVISLRFFGFFIEGVDLQGYEY